MKYFALALMVFTFVPGRNGAASGPGNAADAPASSVAPTWAVIQAQVLDKSCLDCHSSPNPVRGLDLSSLSVVKANAARIFDRAVITQDMPLQPYPRLTMEEKQLLAKWMALGMPE